MERVKPIGVFPYDRDTIWIISKHENVDYTKFWVTSFNGEVLKQKTLDKLKRIKIEQMLFKENWIVGDISYSGFLRHLIRKMPLAGEN